MVLVDKSRHKVSYCREKNLQLWKSLNTTNDISLSYLNYLHLDHINHGLNQSNGAKGGVWTFNTKRSTEQVVYDLMFPPSCLLYKH